MNLWLSRIHSCQTQDPSAAKGKKKVILEEKKLEHWGMTLPQTDFGSPGKDFVYLLIHHSSPFLKVVPITSGAFLPILRILTVGLNVAIMYLGQCSQKLKYVKKARALVESVGACCSSGAVIKASTDEMEKPQQAEHSCFLPLSSFKDTHCNQFYPFWLRWPLKDGIPSLTEPFVGRILMFLCLTWICEKSVVTWSKLGVFQMTEALWHHQFGLEAEDFEATLGVFRQNNCEATAINLITVYWCGDVACIDVFYC